MSYPASPSPGGDGDHHWRPLAIATIPSTDGAFRRHVEVLVTRERFTRPEALEARLRALYPRATVRARELAGEHATWYVYRDGRWLPSAGQAWWEDPRAGRLEVSADGWLVSANAIARGLLGLSPDEPVERYFTDFVAPGTLEQATTLFAIIADGHPLDATIRVRPVTGHVIAVDIHVHRSGDLVRCVLRLADDIEPAPAVARALPPIRCLPADDELFDQYARAALGRMPEPTPAELEIRLRRLYPHAHVVEEGSGWVVRRDASPPAPAGSWWTDTGLPEVRFTDRGLIIAANEPAVTLFGMPLVGRHWHELVTAGTTAQVDEVIDLIVDEGGAVSRFRMPRADGSLVEFDSWTDVTGGVLRTVLRPLPMA